MGKRKPLPPQELPPGTYLTEAERESIARFVEEGSYERAFDVVTDDLKVKAVLQGIQRGIREQVAADIEKNPDGFREGMRTAIKFCLDDIVLCSLAMHPKNIEKAQRKNSH